MQEAADFLKEVSALDGILHGLDDADFDTPTQFKDWTFNDILGHLHFFDTAQLRAVDGADAFADFFNSAATNLAQGHSILSLQYPWIGDLSGQGLRAAWLGTAQNLSTVFESQDPKARFPWVGPPMSARSAITARQMEVWAHGQAIFDSLGVVRSDGDQVKNICHLGVVTYEWTFKNKGLAVPGPRPDVRLKLPSGAESHWDGDAGSISGSATEFAQVVTQTRSIFDTDLTVRGTAAQAWMAQAQCFAGPPNAPPKKGCRYRQT